MVILTIVPKSANPFDLKQNSEKNFYKPRLKGWLVGGGQGNCVPPALTFKRMVGTAHHYSFKFPPHPVEIP
jgi:hypothetical protein